MFLCLHDWRLRVWAHHGEPEEFRSEGPLLELFALYPSLIFAFSVDKGDYR